MHCIDLSFNKWMYLHPKLLSSGCQKQKRSLFEAKIIKYVKLTLKYLLSYWCDVLKNISSNNATFTQWVIQKFWLI